MGPADTTVYQREHDRTGVALAARVSSSSPTVDCMVLNITLGGAKLRIDEPLSAGQELVLGIESFGQFPGRVRWRSGDELGMKFDDNSGMNGETLMAIALYSS